MIVLAAGSCFIAVAAIAAFSLLNLIASHRDKGIRRIF
jgi:hypothetical protein